MTPPMTNHRITFHMRAPSLTLALTPRFAHEAHVAYQPQARAPSGARLMSLSDVAWASLTFADNAPILWTITDAHSILRTNVSHVAPVAVWRRHGQASLSGKNGRPAFEPASARSILRRHPRRQSERSAHMTWYSPILMNPSMHPSWATDARGAPTAVASRDAGIGSAWASGMWTWAGDDPRRPALAQARPPAAAVERTASARAARHLRAPLDVLRQMSEAARASGLSESEVWV